MQAKKFICVFGAMILILICASCGQVSNSTTGPEPEGSEDETPPVMLGAATVESSEQESIVAECTAVADSFTHLYQSALKEEVTAPYAVPSTILSKADYDAIINFLAESNVPILETTDNGCDILINIEDFLEFWSKIKNGETGSFTAYSLGKDGSLFYHSYALEGEKKYCIEASAIWSDDTVSVGNLRKEELAFWDYTEKGNFLFERVYAPPWMGNGRGVIHIGSYDEQLASLAKDYITAVGYYGNNLFTTDWSEEDWGDLNFNDLFEFLYRAAYNTIFEERLCKFELEQLCYYIDSSQFEAVIDTYFDISEDVLHAQALYSDVRGGYPWQVITCSNCAYNGDLIPDVRSYAAHGDGTVTMEIDVLCPTHRTDRLFSHRLIVRPVSDGGFQYVSNEIISPVEGGIPLYCPRIDLQQVP